MSQGADSARAIEDDLSITVDSCWTLDAQSGFALRRPPKRPGGFPANLVGLPLCKVDACNSPSFETSLLIAPQGRDTPRVAFTANMQYIWPLSQGKDDRTFDVVCTNR